MKPSLISHLLTGALAAVIAGGSLTSPISASAASSSSMSVRAETEVLGPVSAKPIKSMSYVNDQTDGSKERLSAGASVQSGIQADVGTKVKMYRVSSRKSLTKALRKITMARASTGYMYWTGSWSSLRKIMKSQSSFERLLLVDLRKLDSSSTTNDADYLMNTIHQMQCNYYRYRGHYLIRWNFTYWEDLWQTKQVNAEVNRIVRALNLHKGGTLKSKLYNLFVLELVTCYRANYDNSLYYHSAYGGLIDSNHATVCQGYAAIMYKFYQRVGIPTHIIFGTGYSGGSSGSHAWNVVKLGKKWYNVDATWDDTQIADQYSCCSYQFFLRGSKNFNTSHVAKKEFRGNYKMNKGDMNWKTQLQ